MTYKDMEPLPVKVVKTPEELTSLAVEFGSTSTFTAPQANTGIAPVQLLQRRPSRLKAIISIDSLGTATGVILAYRLELLSNQANPQGFTITAAPKIFLWENQQPLYALGIGGAVNISVIDEAQAASGAVSEEQIEAGRLNMENQEEGGRYSGQDAGNEY